MQTLQLCNPAHKSSADKLQTTKQSQNILSNQTPTGYQTTANELISILLQ